MTKSVVALVGRPNVGKSTLFNRLCGERIAIVDDTPGTTRDRLFGEAEWSGHAFDVVDTGGIDPTAGSRKSPLSIDSADFIEEIRSQAVLAASEADAVLFLVDGLEQKPVALPPGEKVVALGVTRRDAFDPVIQAIDVTVFLDQLDRRLHDAHNGRAPVRHQWRQRRPDRGYFLDRP